MVLDVWRSLPGGPCLEVLAPGPLEATNLLGEHLKGGPCNPLQAGAPWVLEAPVRFWRPLKAPKAPWRPACVS